MQKYDLLPPDSAASVLRSGGVVAYPTEAVWGLGCDPRDAVAVRRLLAVKQRDEAQGLILIAASTAQKLEGQGWRVVSIDDADRKDYQQTIIINYAAPSALVQKLSSDLPA